MDGTCTVLQKIELQMVTNHAVKTMFTIKTKINTSTDEEKSKILFVRIRDFSTGDCFGLGRRPYMYNYSSSYNLTLF